jgi:hypothetical protein
MLLTGLIPGQWLRPSPAPGLLQASLPPLPHRQEPSLGVTKLTPLTVDSQSENVLTAQL